ncbi:MAG: ABC transporter permease [Chloroflexota bacterium]|nr:ABC transporter permease [Chloroflexota bacterium]
MSKTWIVLKTEFINTITRRSFLLTLILVPLVPAIILGAISLFGGEESDSERGSIFQPPQNLNEAEGYIDQAGVIIEIPAWVGEGRLIEYNSIDAAQQAAAEGEIIGFYIIEKNYLETGAIQYIREDFNPLTAMETMGIIKSVLKYNLLNADQQLFEMYSKPIQVEHVDLAPEEVERDQSNPLSFYLPYGVTILIYALMISSASLLLNSIAKEKENRVMEILISAAKPKELLAGKILGLGLVGLLQMVVWMGSAFLMLDLGESILKIPPNMQLPPEILFWGIVFFVLGYLLYATIMAGVGALVPNLKESSQATFIIIFPLMVPMLMISVIIDQPDATLPVILSLIPFTAPNTIMTRMAVSPVPLWQLLLAVGLMLLTIWFLIHAVSGMFRAQLLVTGKKFSLRLYLKALLGQELESGDI